MTHKDNIKAILEAHFAGFKDELIESAVERIMSIKYTPCVDAIGRKQAREIIRKRLYESAMNNAGYKCEAPEIFKDIAENRLDVWLDEVPNVIPKNEGKWEMLGKWKANRAFGAYPTEQMWICSICGHQTMQRHRHCPNCDADMNI